MLQPHQDYMLYICGTLLDKIFVYFYIDLAKQVFHLISAGRFEQVIHSRVGTPQQSSLPSGSQFYTQQNITDNRTKSSSTRTPQSQQCDDCLVFS